MRDFLNSIGRLGPKSEILVRSGDKSISRAELVLRVEALARVLDAQSIESVALYVDNGIEWILTDLACQQEGIRMVPVPLFFSAEQVRHTIRSSGVQALISDQEHVTEMLDQELVSAPEQLYAGNSFLYPLDVSEPAQVPAGTQKITFTSGSTGTPKGVCLSSAHQLAVAESIAASVSVEKPRHLCVLPLSTLLENIAGVYSPLLAGGTVVAPPLSALGITGSSGLDINTLLGCINEVDPHTMILVPELLNALTTAANFGWRPPPSLKFVAVGGGKVSPDLVTRARKAGLPAFEGYGLSECASVVALNTPGADGAGRVGKPLPHVQLTIDNGEIIVGGSSFLGYVNQPETWFPESVRTGDLGHIDQEGFVVVSGRAKNQLITSFGRNLSPEWIESELTSSILLQQAVVLGDAKPFCVALLYPRNPATTDQEISELVRTTNERLPDYARVLDWYRMPEPNTSSNGRLTENGKPKRKLVEDYYQIQIEHLYAIASEASS